MHITTSSSGGPSVQSRSCLSWAIIWALCAVPSHIIGHIFLHIPKKKPNLTYIPVSYIIHNPWPSPRSPLPTLSAVLSTSQYINKFYKENPRSRTSTFIPQLDADDPWEKKTVGCPQWAVRSPNPGGSRWSHARVLRRRSRSAVLRRCSCIAGMFFISSTCHIFFVLSLIKI
jgi:hypothetical protein